MTAPSIPEQHSGITRRRYGNVLWEFAEWYRTTCDESPHFICWFARRGDRDILQVLGVTF